MRTLTDEVLAGEDVYNLPYWVWDLQQNRQLIAKRAFNRGFLLGGQLYSEHGRAVTKARPHLVQLNKTLRDSRRHNYEHPLVAQRAWRELFYHYFYDFEQSLSRVRSEKRSIVIYREVRNPNWSGLKKNLSK